MWTKGFWKDAAERVLSTFVAVLVGLIAADGFEWSSLGEWSFWAPVLITTAITVAKALGLGALRPNTGASFGTTVPGDLVAAQTDTAGDTLVAGRALRGVKDGTPVDVAPNRPGNWAP